ncbi:MAG: thiamine diphosphokinase [Acutalibacteraceae bacterium]|nr:thiamine diphosphokinase [Acutalibacteraceae bacterium]
MSRCVIICASPYNQPEFIKSQINKDDYIICADGGYDIAVKADITPSIVIGDFDSSTTVVENNIKKIILPVEKDDTDSIYCIKYGISNGYTNFVLFSATGSRADHLYANLSLLKFAYSHNCTAVLKDIKTSIFYTESTLALNCNGCTVSVFPFGCSQATVTLEGFKYPADNLTMTADFPIGTSNIATADTSTVTVHNGGVLVIVNHP